MKPSLADQAIQKYGSGPLLHLINGELVPSLSNGAFETIRREINAT